MMHQGMSKLLSVVRGIRDEYVRAYTGLPHRAWVLFAVNLINASGSMVFFFLSLYMTRELGLTTSGAGRALSVYGIGSLIGAYIGGWLADRIGSITIQKVSLAVCGVFLIALGRAGTIWALLPLLFGVALFNGMLFPANATSMSLICPPSLQVKGFAVNRLAANLGATVGPAVGGVLAMHSYGLIFWVDGLTSLVAAAVFLVLWKGGRAVPAAAVPAPSMIVSNGAAAAENDCGAGECAASGPVMETAGPDPAPSPAPAAISASQDGPREVSGTADGQASGAAGRANSPWRDVPFMAFMLIFLIWNMIFIQLMSTYPIYMRNIYGLAENRIGQLFAVNTVIIVLLEMVLMERIRKYPLTRGINISFLMLGIGIGIIPLGRGFGFAAFSAVLWTFGEMLSIPLFAALVAKRATEGNKGRYMGIFSLIFSLAFILAPPAGTAVYDRFGGDAVWYGCAALSLLMAGGFSLLRRHLE